MAEKPYRRRGDTWALIILVIFLLLLTVFVILPRVYGPRDHRGVWQNAQFHSLGAAISLYKNEFKEYPPSDANDPAGEPYCGAMKLTEAMFGRDLVGFHSDSLFRADGKDADGVTELYVPTDLTTRKGPFLPPESADCLTLADIYGEENTGVFDPNQRVLCDVFRRRFKDRKIRAGMPILYYRADASKTANDINNPNNPDNIYDYRDNHALLALGVPGEPEKKHPLYTDPRLFYKMIKSASGPPDHQPLNARTYILISPGDDGLYGTPDDICNFDWKFP